MKYFVKNTGEEVKVGDVIVKQKSSNKDGLIVETTTTFLVTEETLPVLIKKGIVVQKEEKKNPPITIKNLIAHLAVRTGTSTADVAKCLELMKTIAPKARFSILLKEAALMVDEYYKDHILDRNVVYAWGNVENKVLKLPTKIIKSKDIALFRDEKSLLAAMKLINEE